MKRLKAISEKLILRIYFAEMVLKQLKFKSVKTKLQKIKSP